MTPHNCKYEEALIENANAMGRLEQKLDTMSENQKQILKLLYGNGEPGLKGRVDRLEQSQVKREKFIWWACTSGAAGLVAAIWNWWKG